MSRIEKRTNRKIEVGDPNISNVSVNGEATEDWCIIKTNNLYYLSVDKLLSTDVVVYS